MYKKMTGVLMAGLLALTMVGCGGQKQSEPATTKEAPAQEQKAEETKAEETKAEETKAEPAATEATTTETTDAAATETAQTTPTTDGMAQISEDEAKQVALNDAGVAEADATNLVVYLDTDDGVTKYEVDFNAGGTDYDYDIDATTGTILERSQEAIEAFDD